MTQLRISGSNLAKLERTRWRKPGRRLARWWQATLRSEYRFRRLTVILGAILGLAIIVAMGIATKP